MKTIVTIKIKAETPSDFELDIPAFVNTLRHRIEDILDQVEVRAILDFSALNQEVLDYTYAAETAVTDDPTEQEDYGEAEPLGEASGEAEMPTDSLE